MAKLDVKKVERYSVEVPHEAGQGARFLGAIAEGKANLLGAWGYPYGPAAKIEVIVAPEHVEVFKGAAKKSKLKVKKESAAFYVGGRYKVGAVAEVLSTLAAAGVNVHAVQAITMGGKFGAVVEVDGKDLRKASDALGA